MPDINWGGDATSAPFKSRLDETDGNLVIAEDTNGETRLLEWDGTAWQVRGPVELNGEDVSGVGTLSATDLNADSVNTGKITNRPKLTDGVDLGNFNGDTKLLAAGQSDALYGNAAFKIHDREINANGIVEDILTDFPAGMALIHGGDGTDRFTDILITMREDVSVVDGVTNDAGNRTYSKDGSNVLEMSHDDSGRDTTKLTIFEMGKE